MLGKLDGWMFHDARPSDFRGEGVKLGLRFPDLGFKSPELIGGILQDLLGHRAAPGRLLIAHDIVTDQVEAAERDDSFSRAGVGE